MTSYREIFKQSWKITWNNKVLWFFGFFATLISFGAELKIFSKAISPEKGIKTINDVIMFFKTGIFSKQAFSNIIELIKTDTGSAIVFILFLLLILAASLFFIWLATISQIAIINAVKKISKSSKEKINIKNQLKRSAPKFWPVLLMNVIVSIIINGTSILTSLFLVVVVLKSKTYLTLLYGLLFIVLIPFILSLSFIAKYAIAFMVIDGRKFISATKKAWLLFTKNWLLSIEVAVTLFFINILAIIIIAFSASIMLTLLIGISMAVGIFIFSSQIIFWMMIIISVLIGLATISLGGAIISSFQISSWSELFIKLKENKTSSKLARIFEEQKQ